MSSSKNFIDIFSGCGGLSLGFKNAGYNLVMGIDNDAPSLKTLKYNFPTTLAENFDLFNLNAIDEIKSKLETSGKDIDVIIGGPPCQGFSLTGTRKFNDPRNRLYMSFIDLVEKLKPKAFLIENVPGVKNLYGGKVFREIEKRFTDLEYSVSSDILNSADYGVPQVRKRLFIIGIKKNVGVFKFPEPTHFLDNYISCKDAIDDLPPRKPENGIGDNLDKYIEKPKTEYQQLMRNGADVLWNHVGTNHKDFVIETISQVPDGGNWRDLPEGVGESRKFNEAWTRYNSSKPSRTIDTGHRNHFHYKYNRVPTIRENARLQSFTDDFVFIGNKSQQNRQVGNAVPPLLAEKLAEQIKKYL